MADPVVSPVLPALPSPRRCVSIARWRWPLALGAWAAMVLGVHLMWPELAPPARGALIVLSGAILAWTVLDLDETPVALVAALALVPLGATSVDAFYAGLGHDFIWLLLGAFVLAAAVRHGGLAERLAWRALAGCAQPQALFRRLTLVIAATAFVVPSTSARAALLLPVFLVLAPAMPGPRLVTALALLFPSVILLSAGASMLGAGAHLVALDLLQRLGQPVPGYLGWILVAAPFALLCCLLACEGILRGLLTPAERGTALTMPAVPAGPMDRRQKTVAALVLLTVLAWATSGLHGVPAPMVAVAAGLLATVRRWTGLDLKQAIAQVEWNLLLFMAATLVLGDALVSSGAAAALAGAVLALLSAQAGPVPVLLGGVSALALLAHLVIPSRTARATVLLTTVALPLAATGVDVTVLVFTVVLGSGFCQTLKVSAKPLAVFAVHEGRSSYAASDLLKLSMGLLIPVWALLVLWATVIWPWQGLGN